MKATISILTSYVNSEIKYKINTAINLTLLLMPTNLYVYSTCQKMETLFTHLTHNTISLNMTALGNISNTAHIPRSARVAIIPRSLKSAFDDLEKAINTNPKLKAYQGIPRTNLYKLFIDANRWPKSNPLSFDEKEPGYMTAMVRAFIWLMEIDGPLTADQIEELHDRAIDGVRDRKSGPLDKGFRQSRDGCCESFGLVLNETLSPTGFEELKVKFLQDKFCLQKDDESTNVFYMGMKDPKKTIRFTPPELDPKYIVPAKESKVLKCGKHKLLLERPSTESLSKIPILLKKFQASSLAEKNTIRAQILSILDGIDFTVYSDLKIAINVFIHHLLESKDSEAPRIKRTVKALKSLVKNLDEIRKALSYYKSQMEIYLRPRIELFTPRTTETIPSITTKIIEIFNDTMGYKSLDEIIEYIQNLDQTHGFYDGNIRTYAILLLNYILIKNGFLPTCLDDPNCLDCFSVGEIRKEVERGTENFKKLRHDSRSIPGLLTRRR